MQTRILGLRTTIYQVGDITKAKAWYAKVFQTAPYFDEPYYVGFNIGGYELGLQAKESPKWENVAVFWGVDNMEDAYAYFIQNGAKEGEKPMNVWGEILVATLKDPWDNLIGLIYNPEFRLPN